MRRPNGTGSIVKLSGTRRRPYLVKVPGRNRQGFAVQLPLSYHAKLTEAQSALDDYNARKAEGTVADTDSLNCTVQSVYDGWSAREYAKMERDNRTSSLASYRAAWKNRVSRYASRKMRTVALDEWQAILDEDEDRGLSQSLINNDGMLIRALNAYAMKRDIIAKDYSTYLDTPIVSPKNKKDALTDLQMEQLRNMAEAGVPWADTVYMLCYTGHRITEFLTLTQFSYDEKGGVLRGGIKTAAGRDRVVPVHPSIKPYLHRWLSKHGDTIICDENGAGITSSAYRDHIRPIMEALGIPEATPHWCRHTFATRLHAAGVDELTRKWLLGHSTKADVTDGYTHATLKILTAAIQKIA